MLNSFIIEWLKTSNEPCGPTFYLLPGWTNGPASCHVAICTWHGIAWNKTDMETSHLTNQRTSHQVVDKKKAKKRYENLNKTKMQLSDALYD